MLRERVNRWSEQDGKMAADNHLMMRGPSVIRFLPLILLVQHVTIFLCWNTNKAAVSSSRSIRIIHPRPFYCFWGKSCMIR